MSNRENPRFFYAENGDCRAEYEYKGRVYSVSLLYHPFDPEMNHILQSLRNAIDQNDSDKSGGSGSPGPFLVSDRYYWHRVPRSSEPSLCGSIFKLVDEQDKTE